jgi:hypothetical protein
LIPPKHGPWWRNLGGWSAGMPLVAILLLALVALSVVLRAPLLGDDAFNSYMSGYMGYHGISYLAFVREYNQHLVDTIGRWEPGIAILFVSLWTFTHEAVVAKSLQVVAIIADIFLLYQFVYRLARSRNFALLTSLLFVATLQIRLFYDPVAGIVVHMQIAVGLCLLSLIFFCDYLDSNKALALGLSTFWYAAAGLTYETSYLYIVVMAVIAFARRRSTAGALQSLLPILAVFAVLVAKDLYFRSIVKLASVSLITPNEYVISTQPIRILKTLFIQTIGAIPLEYVYFDPRHYLLPLHNLLQQPSGLAWLTGIVAFIATLVVLRSIAKTGKPIGTVPWRLLTIVGLLLMIVPGIPIALSPRWQLEVIPGMAYLPVYNAGFGSAILLAVIVWYAFGRFFANPRAVFVFAFVYAGVLFTIFQSNALTLRQFDPTWNWARENLDDSLRHGLVSELPENSSIFVDKSYPFFFSTAYIWDSRYLFFMYAHKKVAILDPLTETPANTTVCGLSAKMPDCIPKSPTYELHDVARSFNDGYVSIARLQSIHEASPNSSTGLATSALILDRGRDEFARRPAEAAQDLRSDDFHLLTYGIDYRLFEVDSTCGPIGAEAFADARLVDANYDQGFFGFEHAGNDTWQWASTDAVMTIVNSLGTTGYADFTSTLQTLSVPAVVTVKTGTTLTSMPVTTAGGAQLHLRIKLHPRSAVEIRFHTNSAKPASLQDPRDLHFRLLDPTVHVSGGAC